MPTVAVNAAGWRIEPPVSVAVAPMQSSAATAEAEPPDEPPGTSVRIGAVAPPRIDHRAEARGLVRRAHRELVIVELAEHHRAVAPELRGDGELVSRHEIAEDFRARGGAHALGANRSLMPSGMPASGPPSPFAILASGLARHGARLIRRLHHEGIERARGFDRVQMRVGQFKRR